MLEEDEHFLYYIGVFWNGGTPKWMVYRGSLIKMDDLGVASLMETRKPPYLKESHPSLILMDSWFTFIYPSEGFVDQKKTSRVLNNHIIVPHGLAMARFTSSTVQRLQHQGKTPSFPIDVAVPAKSWGTCGHGRCIRAKLNCFAWKSGLPTCCIFWNGCLETEIIPNPKVSLHFAGNQSKMASWNIQNSHLLFPLKPSIYDHLWCFFSLICMHFRIRKWILWIISMSSSDFSMIFPEFPYVRMVFSPAIHLHFEQTSGCLRRALSQAQVKAGGPGGPGGPGSLGCSQWSGDRGFPYMGVLDNPINYKWLFGVPPNPYANHGADIFTKLGELLGKCW